MRVGIHPLKNKSALPPYKRHRVVVPVYIPSDEGYFASAVDIFHMSFQSLLATIDPEHVSITVIDNACMSEVSDFLRQALYEGRIDKLVCNAQNRGKVAPVVGELLSSHEQFVTLADADVIFQHGWLAAVEEIFQTWPCAGAVSPAAQSNVAFYSNDVTWLYGVLSGQVRHGKFVSDDDMLQFAQSVSNERLYSIKDLRSQYALRRNGVEALIGGGHFVITLRRCCYDQFSYQPLNEGLGAKGMRQIDTQIDSGGWLRLSTTKAYALHMGNTPEPWMMNRLGCLAESSYIPMAYIELIPQRIPGSARLLGNWAARRISRGVQLVARAFHKFI